MNKPTDWVSLAMLFILFSALQLTSCTDKDSDGDGISDEHDKCINAKGKKPTGCPVNVKTGKINLYIETSASMGGYFKGSTAFKQIVSDLAVKMDKEISLVSIHFISDTIRNYSGEATKFSSDIATTEIAAAKSSELHKIFDRIAKTTDNNDVSVLISDCILSFPNAEVKKNSEVNKESASGTLKNNIYATFSELKKRGQAASLYAFSSTFNGKYYDYQNGGPVLKGTIRPFYVWVIAKNQVLPVFDGQLSKIPNFYPEEQLHFGLMDQRVDHYRILTELGRKGEYKLISAGKLASDQGLEDVEVKRDETVEFSAVVDLNALPPYAKTLQYLKSNLVIDTKGCTANVEITERSPAVALKNKKQTVYYEQASHVLKIKVSQVRIKKAELSVSVPLKYDSWYTKWSTMDDRDVKSIGKQTFALQHLIEGVMEAYNNQGKNFIDLKFQIIQK